eukprot:14522636-Ditylum_brightwellii.AAC.1
MELQRISKQFVWVHLFDISSKGEGKLMGTDVTIMHDPIHKQTYKEQLNKDNQNLRTPNISKWCGFACFKGANPQVVATITAHVSISSTTMGHHPQL